MSSSLIWVTLNHNCFWKLGLINFEFNVFSGTSYLCQGSGGMRETISKVLERARFLFYHCPDSVGLFLVISCLSSPNLGFGNVIFLFNLSSNGDASFPILSVEKSTYCKSLWGKKMRLKNSQWSFIALASLCVLEFWFSGSIWVKGFAFSALSFALALRDLILDQDLCGQIVGLATGGYWDIPDLANLLVCCSS